MSDITGATGAMAGSGGRLPGRGRRIRQAVAWVGAVGIYGAAQGLSAWAAQRLAGRGTRPQYEQFERPAYAPPGAVFPVVWSGLNLTTATSAWRIWRAREPRAEMLARREALAWWALAVLSTAVAAENSRKASPSGRTA